MKQTFNPSNLRRARTHGFRARMKTRGGRAVIRARRAKGRARLCPQPLLDKNRSLGFPRRLRLNESSDYQRVFADPIKRADSLYTLLATPNKLGHPRLGVIVSKKNVAKASQRSRIKRQVRESFRLHQHDLPAIDIAVICKRSCGATLNPQLSSSLKKLWDKLSQHARKSSH